MIVRIVTLRYDERIQGFPREPLDQVQSQGAVTEAREHFFVHGGIPHMAVLLVLDEARQPGARPAPGPDPETTLPEPLQPLYRNLRRWRNDRAKADGVPAYALFRNAQLADICRRLPRSLAALREIEGIGEATCAKYGADVLALIPPETKEAAP